MTKLSVNLNKAALLRNQRNVGYPNIIETARKVLEAGAQGITVHPRPDARHIRKTDVQELAAFLSEWHDPAIEFNIEGYPSDDFLALIESVKCHQVTLVPDAPNQNTSDHGWDIEESRELLSPVIEKIHGCDSKPRVSLFIDPDPELPRRANDIGADAIELYTGPYAFDSVLIPKYVQCAKAAADIGLRVNAGHDLSLDNLGGFLQAIPACAEVSIGHAITADALNMGWTAAVEAYLTVIRTAQQKAA